MNLEQRIIKIMAEQKRKPMNLKQLEKAVKIKKDEQKQLEELVKIMVDDGRITETRGAYILTANLGYKTATIVKLGQTFGFAHVEGEEKDIFIPGRCMMGAMVGDVVLIKPMESRGQLEEGEVVKMLQTTDEQFTGILIKKQGKNFVMPDKGSRIPMEIGKNLSGGASEGDKLLASVARRGNSHFDHRAEVVEVFGSAVLAKNCCEAIIKGQKVATEFPEEVLKQAREIHEKGIYPKELASRLDLRKELIFTIDGADSKDLDDAVSIEKTADGWDLGVHIADVSYYVGFNTAIDKEAYDRATSIYYINKVIPMLPEQLCNGICSLNPGEDRLAFSALMKLDEKGKLVSYRFEKSVINSVVKGVYNEINDILQGSATEEILSKYNKVTDKITLMKQLADILTANRMERGGMDLDSSESKIIVDENDKAVDIIPRERGISEGIIEEFMLTANTACALFGLQLKIPFIFRVHDEPPSQKLEKLTDLLRQLGLSAEGLDKESKQSSLAKILTEVKGTPIEKLINNQILRTMAKAEYSNKNIGHFGLVLKNYTHFTSPIRRYPDLIAHRELSLMLTGGNKEKLCKRYEVYLPEACSHCTEREIRAMRIERDCEDCYKAEYMLAHVGETFSGVISSVTSFG
ncbi:MAG: ribonuclease R, partial [Oscillospiraceae bacterium]